MSAQLKADDLNDLYESVLQKVAEEIRAIIAERESKEVEQK
jgi:hypothetical protein